MASDVLTWAGEVRDNLVHQVEIANRDDRKAPSAGTRRTLADLRFRLALIEKLIAACDEPEH
jgi:hypothetical protein